MYQVLARKYRPKNFHQLLGQAHVSQALINAIDQRRLHHAYLFTGTRGVGKTTIARILAKCLNCETGITSEPCGVCHTCQAIDAGRFIDLIEIDAASRTKVEDTRELLDNVPYAPTQGRYKVYLIDEVHMLSTHSFNALLKTLEEPPEHVKFLLATTDPQKLPVTIISRCLQFVLRPMLANQLVVYLGQILRQEHIGFDEAALWQLANSAKGSVRDALSLTDQAIAFGGGVIHADTIEQMLGLIDQADLVALLTAIATQQLDAVSVIMRQLRAQVVDAKAVMDTLADILHQVALVQVLPALDLAADMGLPAHEADKLAALARQIAPPLVQLYYDIIVKAREQLALANTPQQALDMCLLRLLAFKPLAPQFVPVAEPIAASAAQPLLDKTKNVALAAQNLVADPSANFTAQPSIDNQTAASLATQPTNKANHVASNTDDAGVAQAPKPNKPSEQGFDPKLALKPHTNPQPWVAIEPPVAAADDNLTPTIATTPSLAEPPSNPPATNQPPTADIESTLAHDEPNLSADTSQNLDNPDINAQRLAASDAQPPAVFDLTAPTKSADNPATTPQRPAASPFDVLHPAAQTLAGDWTPAKWDYWVYQAREHGWLANDELTLAKHGNMQGVIGGASEFITADRVLSDSIAFENLVKALRKQFSTSTVKLTLSEQQPAHATPAQADDERKQHAYDLARAQISQSPVMQALNAQTPITDFVVALNPNTNDTHQPN